MKAEKFEDLDVWKKAHRLAMEIYSITRDFPGEERFGLVSQMRRAAGQELITVLRLDPDFEE